MTPPLIRTFSHHCRELHGCAVGKIPLDLGIPCPNRLKGGCIFCSAESYTPQSLCQKTSLTGQLERGRTIHLQGRHKYFYGYFQQETPTAMGCKPFVCLAEQVVQQPDCLGLIISTRPDVLPDELLAELHLLVKAYQVPCLLELGVQSIHEKTLSYLNRNHGFAEVQDAIQRIGNFPNLQAGAHLILGVPGEQEHHMLQSIHRLCDLGVTALKLHHLQVIRNTPLHELYRKGEVPLFSLEGFMELLSTLLPHIPPNITLHRLWATAHPEDLIAPRWNIRTAELSHMLRSRLQQRGLYQGCKVPLKKV